MADTLNGLMAIPNLVSVLISLPLLRRLHQEFFTSRKTGEVLYSSNRESA